MYMCYQRNSLFLLIEYRKKCMLATQNSTITEYMYLLYCLLSVLRVTVSSSYENFDPFPFLVYYILIYLWFVISFLSLCSTRGEFVKKLKIDVNRLASGMADNMFVGCVCVCVCAYV